MEQLLTTKLYIPPAKPELVQRKRLLERLNACAYPGCKLILVSAPAGFGKTTLVSEWARAMSGAAPSTVIAWLSLDESDSDLVRFMAYFIAALNKAEKIKDKIGKGSLSMLQSPQPPPLAAFLTPLINEIADIPGRIVLILDDYHAIDSSQVDDALYFLLEHLPPHVHLVIATREDPRLPLSRLRARSQLTELRAADLRFTPSEAADFLNQAMDLDLTKEEIAKLESRTEGWIAGLQLAAISMQGRKDAASLIKSFTGSHRLVLDFLIEEVLGQQSESIQVFLLQTAILDQMNGSLCDAITGQGNSQATLEMLEHANLFIVPLDEERQWYRYHHLFADLLRQRMRQTKPEQVRTLHYRASEWYELNESIDEAIEHALKAGDLKRVAKLIDEYIDALWKRGEHGKLRNWLKVLPDEYILSKPQLGIIRAYYLHTIGEYELGEHLLQEVEKVLESHTDREIGSLSPDGIQRSDSYRRKLQGRVSVTRALIDSFSGDVRGMIQHANRALAYLPEQDLTWRSLAAFALGDAHSYLGDMTASYQARSEALSACEAAGDIYYIIMASLKLASTLREQGELQQTVDVCRQQVEMAKEYGLSEAYAVGILMALLGEALAELNDLENAEKQAIKGVEIAERGENIVIMGFSYLYLMRVLFSRGDFKGAEHIINKVMLLDQETTVPPWLPSQVAIWQARIWLARDEPDKASKWEKERGRYTQKKFVELEDIDFHSLFGYIMSARILIAQGQFDEANRLMQRLLEAAETGGRTTRVIEILMLQALALRAAGDSNQAVVTLERALNLADPRGFFRIFVDEGPPMARLLFETLARGIALDYVGRLLAEFPSTEPEESDSSSLVATGADLIEPLSDRELEVLQLIAEGLTNTEIASRLYLTLNTVKVHTRNIYSKLDAHNRTQAVAKARTFGVLQSM